MNTKATKRRINRLPVRGTELPAPRPRPRTLLVWNGKPINRARLAMWTFLGLSVNFLLYLFPYGDFRMALMFWMMSGTCGAVLIYYRKIFRSWTSLETIIPSVIMIGLGLLMHLLALWFLQREEDMKLRRRFA